MVVGLALVTGCRATGATKSPVAEVAVAPAAPHGPIPRELCKVVLPSYIIEPPDVLTIDAVRAVPRPPYHLRNSDVLVIQVQGTLPEEPIAGMFVVEPGGVVRLGPAYGAVIVAGMTVEEAIPVPLPSPPPSSPLPMPPLGRI